MGSKVEYIDLEDDSDGGKSKEVLRLQGYEKCHICGDAMTGKHYGAFSCDGCKGFFRRSVRKSVQYVCMHFRNCVIDKQKRNQCRYCRLKKCFSVGMKKEAVQLERDRINTKKVVKQMKDAQGLTAYHFMKAEIFSKLDNIHVNPSQLMENVWDLANRPVASIHDVCEVLKEHLLRLTQWALSIPAFTDLPLDDQVILLRGHAGDHFTLWLARSSLGLNQVILLGDEFVIPKYPESQFPVAKKDLCLLASRILEEIAKPLVEDHADKAELSLLQGIIFFDPNLPGLRERRKIRGIRSQVLMNLEDYITDNRREDERGRFGSLLLLLPVLQGIKQDMVEQLTLASLYGVVQIDPLVHEMLLNNFLENTSTIPEILTDLYDGSQIEEAIGSKPTEQTPSSPIEFLISPSTLQKDVSDESLEVQTEVDVSPIEIVIDYNVKQEENLSTSPLHFLKAQRNLKFKSKLEPKPESSYKEERMRDSLEDSSEFCDLVEENL